MKTFLTIVAVGLAFAATAAPTQGATITFSGLAGGNLSPFATYNEGDFQVTPTLGSWLQAQAFGNPTPAIVGASGIATSEITVTGTSSSIFTFQGVDLADANNGGGPKVTYVLEGLLDGSPVFTTPGGPLNPPGSFISVASPSGAVIDELRIRLTSTNTTFPFNVDNIQVTSVPEPATMGLVGLAACSLGGYIRRRRRA